MCINGERRISQHQADLGFCLGQDYVAYVRKENVVSSSSQRSYFGFSYCLSKDEELGKEQPGKALLGAVRVQDGSLAGTRGLNIPPDQTMKSRNSDPG